MRALKCAHDFSGQNRSALSHRPLRVRPRHQPRETAASIAAIRATPAALRAAVSGLTDAQIDTPYREGGWTVRQVVHHVPESHMNAFTRFKLALTEDNPTIKPYEEDRWVRLGDIERTPLETSLVLLDALHRRWVTLLEVMTDADFRAPAPASGQRRDDARPHAAALRVARAAPRRAHHDAAVARGLVAMADTTPLDRGEISARAGTHLPDADRRTDRPDCRARPAAADAGRRDPRRGGSRASCRSSS